MFLHPARGHCPRQVAAERSGPKIVDKLISTCLAEQVAIDRPELETWLADSGWEKVAVTSIAERFFADSEWLANRLAVSASLPLSRRPLLDLLAAPAGPLSSHPARRSTLSACRSAT